MNKHFEYDMGQICVYCPLCRQQVHDSITDNGFYCGNCKTEFSIDKIEETEDRS